MTAIAGVVHEGKVYIGGDSAGTSSSFHQSIRSDPKVFKKGEYVFGFTSSFRMGQLLHYRFDPPVPYDWERDMLAFMSTRFVDAVRECLREYAFATIDKNQEEGGTFLVGFRGALYKVSDDYQVGLSADAFDACGSGHAVVEGSLYSTQQFDLTPQDRIDLALEAASRFNAGVRPPFLTVEST